MRLTAQTTTTALLIASCLTRTGCQNPKPKPDAEPTVLVRVLEEFTLPEPGEAWTFRTAERWQIAEKENRRFLQMAGPSQRPVMPGVAHPREYAIYNKYRFRSFSLSCRVRIDCDPAADPGDVCIIFGWQDDDHFYYAQLSSLPNGAHNTIGRVDGETTRSLLPPGRRPEPAITDNQWHKVDVLRDADTGTIEVYVDAYDPQRPKPPLLRAADRTYQWGCIGLGSVAGRAGFARLIIEGFSATPLAETNAPLSAVSSRKEDF